MTYIKANLFQLLSHARPAIAAKAETGLFFDVRQCDQIRPLSATGRAAAVRTQSTHADIHNMTQVGYWKRIPVFLGKPKPHSF